MRLQYVLKHAWFVCLRVPNTNDEHCWSDRQRYMYLRLRRLVSTVNRHRLHKMQFELFIKLRVRNFSQFIEFPCKLDIFEVLLFLLLNMLAKISYYFFLYFIMS